MGREVLAISGLGVALGGRPILTDVNFALDEGEFVGLIGANGSGKTTLIRTILGFVKASAGVIDVDRTAIGYVPQKIALDPYLPMRARDLVALGLDGHRLGLPWPSASKRRKVGEMLEAVEASAFADQRIGNLSGGQQQRVLIAHALIRRPRLLLLDEPLANLDMRSVAGVVGLLRRVAGAFGATVLISAHDMNPLLPAMDRIVYLAQGRAMAGKADAVVRTEVLSRLYGYHIDVVRVHGRVLVVAAEAEHAAHDALARHPAHIDTIP